MRDVEPTIQEGVMEESPGHVWGIVCHPCGWNPRLAVEELPKIKAERWVGSNCKWLAKEFGLYLGAPEESCGIASRAPVIVPELT